MESITNEYDLLTDQTNKINDTSNKMDIKAREEILMQKNASIDSSPSKESPKSKIPRSKVRNVQTDGTISESSSVSSIPSLLAKEAREERKSLKKMSLAVVKQKRREAGTQELLKTLDEYVSTYFVFEFYFSQFVDKYLVSKYVPICVQTWAA